MKVRIKFQKVELMKFIGHLDFIRAWQKIFRRSGIPIAYSEGFNPHQVFSIASPLAVGVTSDGEYLDLKLNVDSYDLNILVQKVNACVPEGLKVLEAVELPNDEDAAMAACYAASYTLTFSEALAKALLPHSKVIDFFEQETILIKKKNKKGKINDLDIKTGIFEYKLNASNSIEVLLATGSTLNIKAELLMKALYDYFNIDEKLNLEELYYHVHRKDIYTSINPLKTLITFD